MVCLRILSPSHSDSWGSRRWPRAASPTPVGPARTTRSRDVTRSCWRRSIPWRSSRDGKRLLRLPSAPRDCVARRKKRRANTSGRAWLGSCWLPSPTKRTNKRQRKDSPLIVCRNDPWITGKPARIRREQEHHSAIRKLRQQTLRARQLHRGAALAAAGFRRRHVRRTVSDDATRARIGVEGPRLALQTQTERIVYSAGGVAGERIRLLREEQTER